MAMLRRVGSALSLLAQPVAPERRRLLAARWAELPEALRTPLQGFGRQSTGCGATIGLMPRCDFDCRGCYLGSEANSIPPLPGRQARRQLAELRRHLGPKGNVQLTDGEVTLLPEAELLGLVRAARRLGLIPMLMTHGDSFRRRPELLPRLVEAGLREVSIHIDSLQRGRRGAAGGARSEAELAPLRAEMASLIRQVRRATGVRLRAATTLTVSRGNLDAVAGVVAWCVENSDAFGLVSLQPLARVGRTEEDEEGVSPRELWQRIASGLAPFGAATAAERGPLAFGHPDCTRLEPFLVVHRRGEGPRLTPLLRAGHPADERLATRYLDAGLGGLNFRDDPPLERLCRALGALAIAPRFVLGELRRWATGRAAELAGSVPLLAAGLLRGDLRLGSFQVVSHHFMEPAELATERGRERLSSCVFRLPVDGQMLPMCQVNAGGVRDRFYGGLAATNPRLPVVA